MHRLVVSFGDCFTVTLDGFMLLFYKEGGGVWWSSLGEILVEYVQNCDILDQLGRKTLPTGQFLFLTFGYWNGIEIYLTFGYWNGIEIINNYFENE